MSDSEKLKAEAWNQYITPNLETLSAYLARPEWTEMLAPYFNSVRERLTDKLISSEDRTREQERFLAGEIANQKETLALPRVILNHIAAKEHNKKQVASRNETTGY